MKLAAVSLLVVLPCFWRDRIQAGDLASHMYNAWLAELITRGEAPGLFLVSARTNVLFDWWASALVSLFGFAWGEKLAVAGVVLTFFWGAMAFLRAATHIPPWPVAPLLGMAAYGWVFHMGFLNFYWSLGLCFAALALLMRRRLWGVSILILAGSAHMLPVAWAVGLLAYEVVLRRLPSRVRPFLPAAAIAAIAAAAGALASRFPYVWTPQQMLAMLGFDQLWLFRKVYLGFSVAFVALWALGLLWTLHRFRLERLARMGLLHAMAISAFAVFAIPTTLHLPGFAAPLSFVAARMSLPVAALMCGVLLLGGRPRLVLTVSSLVAALYATLIYVDTGPMEEFERTLWSAVRTLPKGARVAAPYDDPGSRVFGHGHLVDRACIGHCFSYGNYEPATTQFRVRAGGPNGIVTASNADSIAIQNGDYTVKDFESPLHFFVWRPAERRFQHFEVRSGERFMMNNTP